MNIGRNAPCPCGSGKKYKQCCDKPEASLSAQPRQQKSNTATQNSPAKGAAQAPEEFSQLVALYNAGRYKELESRARLLVKLHPDFGPGWKLLSASLLMQGKDVLLALQQAAELLPDEAELHYNLGNLLQKLGRPDEAEASYRRALQIRPDYVAALSNMAGLIQEQGRLEEAEAGYRAALQAAPGIAGIHYNLGNILHRLGRLDEAEASMRRVLQIRPAYAEAHNNLGTILYDRGCLEDAWASHQQALQIRPDYAEAHCNLGNILYDLECLDEAEASCRQALQIKPDYAEAHYNLANALLEKVLLAEAEASYRRALQIKPDYVEAYCNLGNALLEMLRLDEARASYRRALQINPDFIEARFCLARAGKAKAEDENLAALIAAEEAARHSDKPLTDKKAIFLHFALGKSYDDIGDHEKAFPHFLEGGRLKRASIDYDPEKNTRYFASIRHSFDRATIDQLRGGDPSQLPIFILGMPRSGTTLTEQILASHPEVHGAGELPDLMAIAQRNIAAATFPDNVRLLDPARLAAWGAEYVAGLQRRAPDVRHITDKMPTNFQAVGLIHLMLPNAKIIHVNRNPIDTCLSCFFTLFKHGHEHTYDLAELGRYYADYARLMEHWRKVLPHGAFLDVQYEDIVADQEAQSRRIIEYCGLEWNDACLDFHQNKRAIRTASVLQVRQPMYKSSVERWRPYEKFLGPLFDALGEIVPTMQKIDQG